MISYLRVLCRQPNISSFLKLDSLTDKDWRQIEFTAAEHLIIFKTGFPNWQGLTPNRIHFFAWKAEELCLLLRQLLFSTIRCLRNWCTDFSYHCSLVLYQRIVSLEWKIKNNYISSREYCLVLLKTARFPS